MISKELEKKINQSIKILQVACKGKKVELAYSGGKDSDVILQLAKEAGIDFVPIYKMTTIDPPLTKKHALDNGCEIRKPKRSFFQLVEATSLPNRWVRYCCSELKEYKIMDDCIIGIRRAESTKRAAKYKEPVMCRMYNKKDHVNQIYPILEWTNEDVAAFIADRGIKCHPLYYDEQGNFHVERRLGCIGCPMSEKSAIRDFKKYPRFVRAYCNAAQKFLDTHPNKMSAKKFKSGYELFYFVYFCKNYPEFLLRTSENIFGEKLNVKQVLSDYFKIEL